MSEDTNYYMEIPVSKWTDLMKFYRKKRPGQWSWAFRGQSNDERKLQTSLERVLGSDLRDAVRIEFRLVREFVRRAHHYSSYIPRKDDVVEWFALMQHHGAPTRLLDWTYSFFVGLHFATESVTPGESCALWAIDLRWFRKRYLELFGKKIKDGWNDGKNRELVREVLEYKKPGVLPINSLRLNERQVTQQGLFFLSGDVTKSFEENIIKSGASLPDLRKHVNKLVIKTTPVFLTEIRNNLVAMNISEASLFPGLDGFARSLRAFARRGLSDMPFLKNDNNIFSEIKSLES